MTVWELRIYGILQTLDYMRAYMSPCVECGTGSGAVLVRDTVDRSGPSLSITPGAWTAFLATL